MHTTNLDDVFGVVLSVIPLLRPTTSSSFEHSPQYPTLLPANHPGVSSFSSVRLHILHTGIPHCIQIYFVSLLIQLKQKSVFGAQEAISVRFVVVAPNAKLIKYHHLTHSAPRLRTELITKTHS